MKCYRQEYWSFNRLLCSWNVTGKNTGVLTGSSVHEMLRARILEWLPFPSHGIFPTQELNLYLLCVSCIGRQTLYHWVIWEAQERMAGGEGEKWTRLPACLKFCLVSCRLVRVVNSVHFLPALSRWASRGSMGSCWIPSRTEVLHPPSVLWIIHRGDAVFILLRAFIFLRLAWRKESGWDRRVRMWTLWLKVQA